MASPPRLLRCGPSPRHSWSGSEVNGSALARTAIENPQLILGLLQFGLASLRQALAGAVDIKGEHRHRRPVWIALAAAAAVRRTLERGRNRACSAFLEDAVVQSKRIARLGDQPRPSARAANRAFLVASLGHDAAPCGSERPWRHHRSRRHLARG